MGKARGSLVLHSLPRLLQRERGPSGGSWLRCCLLAGGRGGLQSSWSQLHSDFLPHHVPINRKKRTIDALKFIVEQSTAVSGQKGNFCIIFFSINSEVGIG